MQARQSVLVFVLALTGCMKPNPLIYTLGDAGDDASGSDTVDEGDPAEAESTLPDHAAGEMCEPLESFGSLGMQCGECLALDCCDLALVCAGIDECLCLADCMLGGASLGTCKNACGGVLPSDIDELDPLLECATAACDEAC
jgi:hypothetical protein